MVLALFLPNLSFAGSYKSWTKKRLSIGSGHTNPRISADGEYLVVQKAVGPVHSGTFWLMKTKSSKPVWKFKTNNTIFDLAISQNGDYIAAVGGKIWLFSKNSKRPLWSNNLGVSVMDSVAITPDGNYIVTGDRFGEVFLFQKGSSTPIRSWQIGSRKGADRDINKIAISKDGKYISAGSEIGVAFIDRDKSKIVWQYKTKRQKTYGSKTYSINDEVMNLSMSNSGRHFAAVTEDNNLYLFDKNKKAKPKWKYKQESFHTANVWVSGNGKWVTFSTNDKYLGFSTKDNQPRWTFDLDGRQSGVAASQNGKYIAVADALDYIHLFDREYSSSQRPFRTFSGSFPDALSLSAKGDKLIFNERDFHFQEIAPAVLADLQDRAKVYVKGQDMNLQMFVTNPNVRKKLNLQVRLSLPQVSVWENFGDKVKFENEGLVSKKLSDLFESYGGDTVYNEDIILEPQKSRKINEIIEVPALNEPDWYQSFFVGFSAINFLIDKLGDVLEKVLPDVIANVLTEGLRTLSQGGNPMFYPAIGLGTVSLSDQTTGEIIDQDTFTFVFLIS
jgi:hypothetical protein